MNEQNNKQDKRLVRVDDIPLGAAFRHDGVVYLHCGSNCIEIKARDGRDGCIRRLGCQTLVEPEPDAEIHIGPHPDKADKAKCVKLLEEIAESMRLVQKMDGFQYRINTLIAEMEADDGNV